MSFEYQADPSRAACVGLLAGKPEAYFLSKGEGEIDPDSPPFIPDFPRMQAAAEAHRMEFRPDFTWPDA
jgi:quercetin 2,3-dioxygenase